MGMKNSLALISAILVFAVIIGAESTSVTSNYEEARKLQGKRIFSLFHA